MDRIRDVFRGPWLPAALTAVLVIIGVPLFFRAPLWADVTLYDTAARAMLDGGTLYRDVFDTNTPGYVWTLAGLRSLVGWSSEALRAVDLAVFAGIAVLVARLARLGGATWPHALWVLAACCSLYLFAEETVHCQRDVWLTLPALTAVALRVGRGVRPRAGVFLRSFAEGLLWSAAVWVKPHALVIAAGVWALTARRLAGTCERPGRGAALDLAGNLLAGVLAGGAGVWWLRASGTWPHFIDVMTNWNPGYLGLMISSLGFRAVNALEWFPPWSLLIPSAGVVAVLAVLDGRPWALKPPPSADVTPGAAHSPVDRLRRWLLPPAGTDGERFARGALGGAFLVWAAQSFFLQRPFQYVHVTETFLVFAVLATARWRFVAALFAWQAVVVVLWLAAAPLLNRLPPKVFVRHALLARHPATLPARLRLWPTCWRTDLTEAERDALQDALRQEKHPAGGSSVELRETAGFLRQRHTGDGELIAWHDSPHQLYLMLGVKPGLRYMHVVTASSITDHAWGKIQDETRASGRARYAVIDLQWFLYDEVKYDDEVRAMPFDTTRPVFRSGGGAGRYLVFAIDRPNTPGRE